MEIRIYLDEDENPEFALERITKLIAQGYTSGIGPNWEIIKNDKN